MHPIHLILSVPLCCVHCITTRYLEHTLPPPLPLYHTLSHTFSPTFLHAILPLWQQSRSSLLLLPVHLPFFNSESKPLKKKKSWIPFLCSSLCVSVLALHPRCSCLVCPHFPSSLSSLYSSPSPCLLLSTLPVVSLGVKEACCVRECVRVCVRVLLGKVSLDWASHLAQRGPGLHYYHKAVTNSI